MVSTRPVSNGRQQHLQPYQLIKICRPALSAVHVRERVHRLLDEARRSPLVWISAPPGAGKTTAIASYLDSRNVPGVWYQIDASDSDVASFFHYMGLAVRSTSSERALALPSFNTEYVGDYASFVAGYFRELFATLPPGSTLVFDNVQEIDPGNPGRECALYDTLLLGLLQAPIGTSMIFLSRQEPPAAFARARATGQMTCIHWDALKATEQESIAIVEARCSGRTAGQVDALALHRRAQGWVAGLLLLSERACGALRSEESGVRAARPCGVLRTYETQLVFDYLDYEMFRHATSLEQELLLITALLPSVDVETAQCLSRGADSAAVLERLARRNFFTFCHPSGSYEYHPLFRAFLLSRAKQHFGELRLNQIRSRVAQLLVERRDFAAATELLLQIQDWGGALTLIHHSASQLLEQGRHETLSAWLCALPEDFRESHPWALYWLGSCAMQVSGASARELLQRALAGFEAEEDATPVVQAWCALVDSMVSEWRDFAALGELLARFSHLIGDRRPPGSAVAAASVGSCISGLLWARPDDPALAEYMRRADEIFEQEQDAERRIVFALKHLLPCHYWVGEFDRCKSICATIAARPPQSSAAPWTRLLWCLARAQLGAMSGANERAVAAVDEGLAIAEATDVHALDVQLCREAICAHIGTGNIVAARKMLDRMSLSPGIETRKSWLHELAALLLIHEGNDVRAIEEAGHALDLSKHQIGVLTSTFCLATALLRAGELAQAATRLGEARRLAERMGSALCISTCSFMEALLHLRRNDREQCRQRLSEFLAYSRQTGITVPWWATHADAADVLSFAFVEGANRSDVQKLIVRARLAPPRNSTGVNWPWPVKIFTFGRLLVLKNDVPLAYSGKTQTKPLELLSALIAFGGRDVGMNNLAQQLWPEAEGDSARTSLRTTLLRLRRLVGDAAVIQQGSCLSLNPERCWLDLWAFERVSDRRAEAWEAARRVEQLLALYTGTFLPNSDDPLIIGQRERLRTKALRVVLDAGRQFEDAANPMAAIDVYQKGIEIDSMSEEIYRRLMRCYLLANRATEASSLYQRYRALLNRSLQIEPAAETKSLFNEIQQLAG